MNFLIATRFEGEERELLYIKAGRKGDFYSYLKYPRERLGLSRLDLHVSYHKDGYRQLSIRGMVIGPKAVGRTKLQPTSGFRGVEIVLQAAIRKGQFAVLSPLRKSKQGVVLLDLDSAGFRDDMTFVRAYLVEPDQEEKSSHGTNVGPHVSCVLKDVIPWIVVEIFQEKLPA